MSPPKAATTSPSYATATDEPVRAMAAVQVSRRDMNLRMIFPPNIAAVLVSAALSFEPSF